MTQTVTPLANHVLVEPIEAESVTPGGILLPDTARKTSGRGKVVAVGEGARVGPDAVLVPVALAPGDTVLYGQYAGFDLADEIAPGRKLKMLREDEILARLA